MEDEVNLGALNITKADNGYVATESYFKNYIDENSRPRTKTYTKRRVFNDLLDALTYAGTTIPTLVENENGYFD